MAQNYYICPPTLSQYAALACFTPESLAVCEARRAELAQRRALVLALASMALAWVGVQLLRLAVPAPRPAQLGIGVQWIEHAARAGFPSMHVAGAAELAASLALRPVRGLTWLAAAVTAAMVWSRVCLGVHFPSDVLAGLLTGGLAAAAIHALAARVPRWQATLLHKSPQGNAH